jgi:sodium-dependent dicarboxylate transporter 2/3/5
MALALPMLAVMGLLLLVLLYALHRPGPLLTRTAGNLREYLDRERAALGGWTAGQINTLLAFALAIVLWVLPGVLALFLSKDHPLVHRWESCVPESVVALLAAGVLFMLPVQLRAGRFTLSWDEAVKIDWGTILLFGGGLSLGDLMFQTGVAGAMGREITDLTGADSLWTITAASIAMSLVITETSSNTAAANMIIPVAISLAQGAHVNPVPPALGACFGASFAFMLPVSTPPNAIVYGSRLVPITKMIRAGVLYEVCGFGVIFGGLRVLCPLLGFSD